MPAAVIAQLLIAFGPSAINLIQQLVAVWNKPTLTPDEVNAIIAPLLSKSAQDYLNAAQGTKTS
jgi:hypothetical protein